ncbi:MAG: septal ring lytic transglycosylase RlpA family protein [Sphaerochaetaceae bacterium]|jgi:rare lipoprotein A
MKKIAICMMMIIASLTNLWAADAVAEPAAAPDETVVVEKGVASWYTSDKPESLTANGEVFDPTKIAAAHKTMKFGTIVRLTNLNNGKTVDVRINDRGPYVDGRIIDLTPAAAKAVDMVESGIAPVTLQVIYEPEVPESKYKRAGDTGWYLLQLGAYSSTATAYTQYERLLNAGLRPAVEIVNDSLVRLSVRWVPAYQLDRTLKTLSALGFREKDILKKSEDNPYIG